MRRFDSEWDLLVRSRGWFEERGYRLTDSMGPGMQQGLYLYSGERIAVRLTADRGQWLVEVRPGAAERGAVPSEDWFDVEAWSDCLGHLVLFHAREPAVTDADRAGALAASWLLEPQLDYLRTHLGDIEKSCSQDRRDAVRNCLVAAQHRLRDTYHSVDASAPLDGSGMTSSTP
jgi:hypothetical protein